MTRQTVIAWRARYEAGGLDALADLPRSGRPPVIDEAAVITSTLNPPPEELGAVVRIEADRHIDDLERAFGSLLHDLTMAGDGTHGGLMEVKATAVENFAEQLRTLRMEAGNPSFRKMAGRSGRISHTTLHEAAAGTRFPSWETTREFVRACEADEAPWRRRWEDAQPEGALHAESIRFALDPGAFTASHANSVDLTGSALVPAMSELVPAALPALPAPVQPAVGVRRHRRRWFAVAVVMVLVAVVLGVTVHGRSRNGSTAAAATPPKASSDARIPGDVSKFVGDVTIPDGTRVKVNAHFVKVWAVANAGTVRWHHRYMVPMHPGGNDAGCQVPERVLVGDTSPGEQVMISVEVTAASHPGRCWVGWKMVDEDGQYFYPSRRPIYFLVNVIK